MAKQQWKTGRGKLGPLMPLLGEWTATADFPMGVVRCERFFMRILGEKYIQLTARWDLGAGRTYEEVSLFGIDGNGVLSFWSFTSDGRQAKGHVADVTDIHPDAIGFEAQMPAGLARQAYWPDPEEGFHWAVESQTKKGWNRFTEHHYRSVSGE